MKKKSKTEQQRTGTSRYKWNCRAMRELTIKILMSSVVFTAAQTALASLRMVCVSPPELSSHEIYVCSCNNTVSARSSRRVVTWQSQYPPARHYQQQTFQLNQQRPLFFNLNVQLITFQPVRDGLLSNRETFSLSVVWPWSYMCLTCRNANLSTHMVTCCSCGYSMTSFKQLVLFFFCLPDLHISVSSLIIESFYDFYDFLPFS